VNKPKRLRRKPTEINAIQWNGENVGPITKFGATIEDRGGTLWLWVEANNAWLPLQLGEWIAKDFLGYYPIKQEAVRQNYEEVTT
jgi:hypothetical protein